MSITPFAWEKPSKQALTSGVQYLIAHLHDCQCLLPFKGVCQSSLLVFGSHIQSFTFLCKFAPSYKQYRIVSKIQKQTRGKTKIFSLNEH